MSEKKGFFKRLAQGLSKTRDNIASSFDSIFSGFLFKMLGFIIIHPPSFSVPGVWWS